MTKTRHDPSIASAAEIPAVSRRDFVAIMAAAGSVCVLSSAASANEAKKALLPLNTPKIDHLDVIVPDVVKTTKFYMGLFNTKLHAQPFQGGFRYFVLLGDLPESRQVGYLAIGESRGRGTYIGHFCTSVFDYRDNAAALTTAMTEAFDAAGFGKFSMRGGPGGLFSDPDGIEVQFLPAPDVLITAAVPSDLVPPNQGLLKPKGVDHVLLKVSNMKKALQFYRILYGKEAINERKTGRIWFQIGDTRLGLEEAQYKFGDTPRIDHFGIKVEPFDRNAVTEGLKKLGAEVLPAQDESDMLRFRDVDGITVELKAV